MRLIEVYIRNYRNLDGLHLNFMPTVNFIVGENNIGKSNFLNLLESIFTCSFFEEYDFSDINLPIEIDITLGLENDEYRLFNSNFCTQIELTVSQECSGDNYLKFTNRNTGTNIPHSSIKMLNYLGFDSLKNPTNDVYIENFTALSVFVDYLTKKQIEICKANKSVTGNLCSNLIKFLEYSKRFNSTNIAAIENIFESMQDYDELLNQTLDNIPFSIKIILSIFERILKESQRHKKSKFTFSMMLVLDEPEIHMHPYMQRTLVKEILNVMENENDLLNKTLKELFGLEKIDGQIIIVTHSSNIILNKYREIIRVYREGSAIRAISGANLRLSSQNQKHMLMQFTFIKEAMFSKVVIIVEGETEYGSMTVFGNKMNIDFDKYGIALIKSSGAGSIIPLMKLFESFKIPAIGIMDSDIKVYQPWLKHKNLFFTETPCFESEIIEHLMDIDREDVIHSILGQLDKDWKSKKIFKSTLNKIVAKFGADYSTFKNHISFNENLSKDMRKLLYLSHLYIEKSIILGHIIAENLSLEDIPNCYKNVILRAVQYHNT